jgi:hypothetical protein
MKFDIHCLWFVHQCKVEYEREFCNRGEITPDISDNLWYEFKKVKELIDKIYPVGDVHSIFYYVIRNETFINHYRKCLSIPDRLKEFISSYDEVMAIPGTREFLEKNLLAANKLE